MLEQEVSEKDYNDFLSQGFRIVENVPKFMDDNFGEYEVIDTEKDIRVPVPFEEDLITEFDFVGYVDCIIKTEDGRHHIIDWKSCSWGWDAEKRSDKMVTYQLTLYKKFFCQKHDIDPKDVETYFGLLKRTAKEDNVEIFRVTSGSRKTTNATKTLTDACKLIHKGVKVKNRKSCAKCPFNNTEHCTR